MRMPIAGLVVSCLYVALTVAQTGSTAGSDMAEKSPSDIAKSAERQNEKRCKRALFRERAAGLSEISGSASGSGGPEPADEQYK